MWRCGMDIAYRVVKKRDLLALYTLCISAQNEFN
jgi:hypothetical protein